MHKMRYNRVQIKHSHSAKEKAQEAKQTTKLNDYSQWIKPSKMKIKVERRIFRLQPLIREQLYFVNVKVHRLFFLLIDARIDFLQNHPNTR